MPWDTSSARDLAGTIAYRGARVGISDIIDPTIPDLAEILGDNALHGFQVSLAHNTRDNPFLATEGHLIQASVEQVIGTWQYPRAEVDLRQYFTMHERPDGSGRHVLSLSGTRRPSPATIPPSTIATSPAVSPPSAASPSATPRHGLRLKHARRRSCRRRLRTPRLGRVHVPHHRRRHAPRRGLLRYRHGRADDQQLDQQISRSPGLRPADHRPGHGPRPDRLRLRLPRRPGIQATASRCSASS